MDTHSSQSLNLKTIYMEILGLCEGIINGSPPRYQRGEYIWCVRDKITLIHMPDIPVLYLWWKVKYGNIEGIILVDPVHQYVLQRDPDTNLLTTNPSGSNPTRDPRQGAVLFFQSDNTVLIYDTYGSFTGRTLYMLDQNYEWVFYCQDRYNGQNAVHGTFNTDTTLDSTHLKPRFKSKLIQLPFDQIQGLGATQIYSYKGFSGCQFYNITFGSYIYDELDPPGLFTDKCIFEGTTINEVEFKNCVLSTSDFSNAKINGCPFSDVPPDSKYFRNMNQSNVLYRGTEFTKTRFENSPFKDTDMTNATFTNVRFDLCSFEGVNVSGASFSNCTFSRCNLSNGNFTNVHFSTCAFESCQITKPGPCKGIVYDTIKGSNYFRDSTIAAEFLGMDWTRFDLSTTTIVNLPKDLSNLKADYAILNHKDFNKINFANASFKNAQLQGVNFSGCNLTSAHLNGANLGGITRDEAADLSYAVMIDTDLTGAMLTNANLSFVSFYGASGASLKEVTADSVNFSNAFLAGIDFSSAKSLLGINFSGACLVNAVISNVILDAMDGVSVKFDGAALQGADFSSSEFLKVSMVNAAISTSPDENYHVFATLSYGGKPQYVPWVVMKATVLAPSQTGHGVTCPMGNYGPCSQQQLDQPLNPTLCPSKHWPASYNPPKSDHKEDS
jgi:uncharacterized protein YjbI with pentapeptide repeats